MEERKTVQIDYETLKKLTGYVKALSVRSWCCNEEIAKIYEKAIELGDGKAACNLGFMYQKGLIGKKNGQPNYEKAAEMYEKAVKLGDGEAAFNLGKMYLDGVIGQLIVVEKGKEKKVSNLPQAKKLFNIAKSRAQTVEDKNCIENILENIKKQELESSIEEFIIYLREGLRLKGF